MIDECSKQILSSLRQISQAIDIYSRKLRSEYQITVPQLVCLNCLIDNGTLSVTAISEKINLSKSTLVGILDRLEAKGLISRERDTADRRVVSVTANKSAKKLIKQAPSPLQDKFSEALKKLLPEEQDTLAKSLQKVAELMGATEVPADSILETGELNKLP